MSNIQDYQLEAASQRSPSQNSPLCCTQVIYLQKDHLRFSLVAAIFLYIHKNATTLLTGWFGGSSKPTIWIKKKAVL